MTLRSQREELRREMAKLRRSMDFVADRYLRAGRRETRQTRQFAEVYQQLGLAWQLLGLKCRHWDGFRRVRGGRRACRICGLIAGVDTAWILLPTRGRKRIGTHTRPSPERTEHPNRKAATRLRDTIDFHGAHLEVEVNDAFRTRLVSGMRPITVAPSRRVTLKEDDCECHLGDFTASLRLARGSSIPHALKRGAFAAELPRRVLERCPVLFELDQRHNFLGVTIFKPSAAPGSGRTKNQAKRTTRGRHNG